MAKDPRRIDREESDYDENEDEDFAPDTAAGDDDVSSSSEDEDAPASSAVGAKKRKEKIALEDAEFDSGDEVTIKERKSKRRKVGKGDEESGGEGGVVRTRAQRAVEKEERKLRKETDKGEVTVDVEALWAELSAMPIGRPASLLPVSATVDSTEESSGTQQAPEQLVKIKRRIAFAGEITEVEEEVPLSSAAARNYLASEQDSSSTSTTITKLQRPLRRPSLFEPNPTATIKGVPAEKLRPRAPSRTDVLVAERKIEEERKKKAERMSTVQKSALDWRGFVREQGIGEELDEYGKSKRGFLAREEFLDRVAGAKEGARRDARLRA